MLDGWLAQRRAALPRLAMPRHTALRAVTPHAHQVAGVGDRPSDLKAYYAAGLHACMTVHAEGSSASVDQRVAELQQLVQELHIPAARVSIIAAQADGTAVIIGDTCQEYPSVWQAVETVVQRLVDEKSTSTGPEPIRA